MSSVQAVAAAVSVAAAHGIRLDGAEALRVYGADPDDPALALYQQARAFQGTLWTQARARLFPDYAPRAAEVLDAWLGSDHP